MLVKTKLFFKEYKWKTCETIHITPVIITKPVHVLYKTDFINILKKRVFDDATVRRTLFYFLSWIWKRCSCSSWKTELRLLQTLKCLTNKWSLIPSIFKCLCWTFPSCSRLLMLATINALRSLNFSLRCILEGRIKKKLFYSSSRVIKYPTENFCQMLEILTTKF